MDTVAACESHSSGLITVTIPGLPFRKPEATELRAFESIKTMSAPLERVLYFAIPWSEVLDKRAHIDVEEVLEELKRFQGKRPVAVTVVQHREYKRLMEIFIFLGISAVYASHCSIKDCTSFVGLWVRPFPLYACNAEHPTRRGGLVRIPVRDKLLLYSFVGRFSKTGVRGRLFSMRHPKRGFVQDTESHVFYNEALTQSIFALCPVGRPGLEANTSRVWEALAVGSVPVILADGITLPYTGEDWAEAVVTMKENNVEHLANMLSQYTLEDIERFRSAGNLAYSKCSGNQFCRCIIEELVLNKSI